MRERILIYDDDEEILLLCKTILSKFNFIIETFSKCDTIVQDIERLNPQLVLMDLWIPEMGGQQAVSIMKENKNTSNTPVLLFSANSNIREISKQVNADGYLEKPFSIKTLIETVQVHKRRT